MLQLRISFDCTGSMYPCLSEVRDKVIEFCDRLFKNVPDLEIAITTHGDYRDGDNVINIGEFTKSSKEIERFVNTAPQTDGYDSAECYEFVLHKTAIAKDWKKDAQKIFILIGDDIPHDRNYLNLDWRKEALDLSASGVNIYSVQCMGRYYANSFYSKLAEIGKGTHLDLAHFYNIIQLIEAIVYREQSMESLDRYEQTLVTEKIMNRNLSDIINKLRGKKSVLVKYKDTTLESVDPHRFQILRVNKDTNIKDFVTKTGAKFELGKGFYEFTKKETVQEYKEVVLMDKDSGDLYSGKKAREMIGLPYGERGDIRPVDLGNFRIFVQSTSVNRKLLKGTFFLYEV